jgi:mannose-6-phosphate isomerase-like protein (cupin superfamily)
LITGAVAEESATEGRSPRRKFRVNLLAGGCAVVPRDPEDRTEGTRRFRVPISSEIGANEIVQTISLYDLGRAPSRRNPFAEEVLYVVKGFGACQIDDFAYPLRPGTAVYIPPGSIYQVLNTQEDPMEVVGVACPEERVVQIDLPMPALSSSTPPGRTILKQLEPVSPSQRNFKVLADRDQGCKRVTQFLGVIPPGPGSMHRHLHEEVIYILEGEGRVVTSDREAKFSSGASIYLPRGVSHSLENDGTANIRMLGVFYPAEPPANHYEE